MFLEITVKMSKWKGNNFMEELSGKIFGIVQFCYVEFLPKYVFVTRQKINMLTEAECNSFLSTKNQWPIQDFSLLFWNFFPCFKWGRTRRDMDVDKWWDNNWKMWQVKRYENTHTNTHTLSNTASNNTNTQVKLTLLSKNN